MRLRAARAGALLLLLLGSAPAPACGEPAASFFEVRLSLQRPGGGEATRFASGEGVVFVLAVRNASELPQSLSLPSTRTSDFAVSGASGAELWRWSDGRAFAQMLTELAFAPGEEKSFQGVWDQRIGGAPLAPGRYLASGWLGARESGPAAAPVGFSID